MTCLFLHLFGVLLREGGRKPLVLFYLIYFALRLLLILWFPAPLFSRRTHDTACLINKSIQVDNLPDENLEL